MRFYVVGSALVKEDPRDVDMYGVMDDELFKHVFGMTPEEFQVLRRPRGLPEMLKKWQHQVDGATRILQFVFPELVPLDFKFLPESLLQEPHKEVDLTSAPESWGITFPNLETHLDVAEH